MGSFKELGELLRDAKGTIKEVQTAVNDVKGNSIAKRSSAATLQFPVIMSRSINVDTASSVVKALERQYATFVQMVIALNPVIDWNEHKNVEDYVKTLHQNNPTPIDLIESCINVYSDEELGLRMITSINEGCSGQVIQANKQGLICVEDHLNKNKLNDLYKPAEITLERANASLDYFILSEAKHRPKKNNGKTSYKSLDEFGKAYKQMQNGENPQPNADGPKVNMTSGGGGVVEEPKAKQQPNVNDKTVVNGKATAADPNKGKSAQEGNKGVDVNPFNGNSNKHAEPIGLRGEDDKRKEEIEKAKFKLQIDKDTAMNRAKTMVKLSDNDIKKCNELVPTTLSVSVQQVKGDNFGTMLNFILGIKGVMHPVNSEEMVSNLLDGYKSGNKFFNFLRWTSGEISFFKDLLFNVEGIKEDVVKKHSKSSHWWTTLKRNRTLARVKNASGVFKGNKGRIMPNATIVCSMEEVMEIQDVYNVDLMDPKNVLRLMDRYFLLGFAIVDESQELVYFIFDGEREFQALSFKGLERENNNKNDFKDIYKMINSGRL